MSKFEQLWALTPEAFQQMVADEMRAQQENTVQPAALPLDTTSPHAMMISLLERSNEEPSFSDIFGTVQGVAVIPVSAMLLRNSVFNRWAGQWVATGRLELQAMLALALADPAVKGVLFDICSPGGDAAGVHELAESIAAARRQKPCAAYADSLCASAAYWLAAATGRVYAGASATVGSIGVVYRHSNYSAAYKDYGVAFTYVTAGSQKVVGADNAPLSDRDKDILQNRVNAIYELFTSDVAQHMGLALEARDRWADGRCFMGQEALDLGLVSSLAISRDDAITQFTKEIGMDRKEFAEKYPQEFAAIQQEAVQAYQAEQPQTADNAAIMAMVEGLCGAETADRIKTLCDSGMTEAQFKAILPLMTNAVSAKPVEPQSSTAQQPVAKNATQQVLDALLATTPHAVNSDASSRQPDDADYINLVGNMK